MDKTATEVVLQLVASGMEKEAGRLTSPIRKILRGLSPQGRELNRALALRAERGNINKDIVRTLRSGYTGGDDVAKAFNEAKPGDRFAVLTHTHKFLKPDHPAYDDLNNVMWRAYRKYSDNRSATKSSLRSANMWLSDLR